MAFQIKDFASITASMINWMRAATSKITDYTVGSVARTLVEAPAAEIDQLYQEMFHGLKEAIPVSTYTTFGFDKLGALASVGGVTFTATGEQNGNILIPVGTRVRNAISGALYETTQEVTIAVGVSTGTATVQALTPGAAGNCAANTVTELVGSISGIVGVSNQGAIAGGRDAETDDQRKLRFVAYINSLSRGTPPAVMYGAKTAALENEDGQVTERVVHAKVVALYDVDNLLYNPGFLELYVHNGVGDTSLELVQRAQQVIDGYYDNGVPVPGWKAAGVVVATTASEEVLVNVDATLTISGDHVAAEVLAAASNAIHTYLLGLAIGDTVILNELIELSMAIPGVIDVAYSLPADNITMARNQKAMPGTLTLTEA